MYVAVVIYLVRSDSSTTEAGTATAARPRPGQARPVHPRRTPPRRTPPVPRITQPQPPPSVVVGPRTATLPVRGGGRCCVPLSRQAVRPGPLPADASHGTAAGDAEAAGQLIPPHRERPPQWCSVYCRQAARSIQRSSVVVFRPHSPSPGTSDRGVRVRQQSRLTAAELDALRP